MKKYIYGTILMAVIFSVVIFFFKPPETADQGPSTTIAITFRLPENDHLTEDAPFMLTWRTEDSSGTLSAPVIDKKFNPFVSPYRLVFKPAPDSKAVILNARIYYCHQPTNMCFQKALETRILLPPSPSATIAYTWDITPQQPQANSI